MKNNNSIDDVTELISLIVDGKLTAEDTRFQIEKMEKEQGDFIFLPCEFHPKNKPWDNQYLKQLIEMNYTGISSKEYILHLAEVVCYRKKIRLIRYALILICIILLIIVISILAN